MQRSGPVFVAGVERSGTSLLYALLASHPDIAMTRRTNLWTYFYGQYGDLSDRDNFERCLQVMMRYQRLVKLQPDPDRLRREFWQGEPSYARLFALLEEHHAARLGKPRWGDKSLNTERYADRILAAYPAGRILHMVRDPRDRCASVLRRWSDRRRSGVGGATAEWLASATLARRNHRRHPERYRIVRYEQLVRSPEETLRDICAFIDAPYAGEMLTMQGASEFRQQGSNSSYGARPVGVISTDSIGRAREVLSPPKRAFILATTRRHLTELGYPVDPPYLHPDEWIRFLAADLPLELARLLAWRARDKVRGRVGRSVPSYRLIHETSAA
jgi:hypothetical protein